MHSDAQFKGTVYLDGGVFMDMYMRSISSCRNCRLMKTHDNDDQRF